MKPSRKPTSAAGAMRTPQQIPIDPVRGEGPSVRRSSSAIRRRRASAQPSVLVPEHGGSGKQSIIHSPSANSATTTTSASDYPTSNTSPKPQGGVGRTDASNTFQSGCSVKAIHDIVSVFDDRKRKLVQEIGFSGLLEFPPIKATNRKFSVWLMQMVDIRNSCLTLPDRRSLEFCSSDIGLVFGIPASGKNVNEAGQMGRNEKEKMKLQCWPLSGKNQQSIKAVEELLSTNYLGDMTSDEEDAFKVAFVVFVMSTLFVPGAKHDYVHVDYWGALSDPKRIDQYNWSAYVHKRLIAPAAKYKTDIETGSRTPNITGCYLFLQVFYLDNMDMGSLSLDHSVRPRISCFTYDRLRAMISADTHKHHEARSQCVFGNTKVRPREQSCYSWAQASAERQLSPDGEAQINLWHAVISMATVLRVPLEAAGPLFLAATEFDAQCHASRPPTGIECISVLLKIMEPFIKGFHYNFDLQHTEGLPSIDDISSMQEDRHHTTTIGDSTNTERMCSCRKIIYSISQNACSSVYLSDMLTTSLNDMTSGADSSHKRARIASRAPTTDYLAHTSQAAVVGVDYLVIKSMSKFYLFLRYVRERNRLDLNATSVVHEEWQPTTNADRALDIKPAKTPWELGDVWGYTTLTTPDIAAVGSSTGVSTQPMRRIVDYIPKYIEVMPEAARDQKNGDSELEMDMFDAMIRSFKQSDDEIYQGQGRARWRHFFESDILAAVIAGWFDIDNQSMRNQFVGTHLSYDLYNCNILFFPVILHERWVCLAWKLQENQIVIFDPACLNIPGFSRRSIYARVAGMLQNILSSVIPILFPKWVHPWAEATISSFPWRSAGMTCWNRTGVLCAYFCRCYDGEGLVPDVTQAHIGKIVEALFADVSAAQEQSLRNHVHPEDL